MLAMRIAVPAAAVVAVAALVLSACSSTSNGTPTSAASPTGQVPSSASTPTGFPPSSSTSSTAPSSGGLTEAQAQAALLTAAEVGSGFVQTQTNDIDTPLPCKPDDPPLSHQFPPAAKVDVDFGGAGGKALFSEEIETFDDAGTIAQVIAAGEKGLGCKTATVSGTKIAIEGPTDLTSDISVPVDKAEAWVVTSTALHASLVIVAMNTQLVVFSFTGDPSVDDSQLPDPPTLITTGLRKVQAALK
jgi:hypothetical protein